MAGLDFSVEVERNGYAWWYLDALSDDGSQGLTIIAFIGSVFSPYYAWARKRHDAVDPNRFVSINAALYLPRGKRWSLTERSAGDLARSPGAFRVGPSGLSFEGDRLVIDIEEITVPIPRRLKGQVIVHLDQINQQPFQLDPNGRHRWQPIAPRCEVEVNFERPGVGWRGRGYLDSNRGSEPLEAGFRNWWWLRSHRGDGTHIQYETESRGGDVQRLAVRFDDASGKGFLTEPSGKTQRLRKTGWRIERPVRVPESSARVLRTFEDTPFYSRSLVELPTADGRAVGVHESLNLDRFAHPVVQLMLPFRMPRRAR